MGGPGAALGEGKATAMAAEGDEGWRRGLMSIGGSGSSGGGGGSGSRLLSTTRGSSGVGGLDAKVSQSPRSMSKRARDDAIRYIHIKTPDSTPNHPSKPTNQGVGTSTSGSGSGSGHDRDRVAFTLDTWSSAAAASTTGTSTMSRQPSSSSSLAAGTGTGAGAAGSTTGTSIGGSGSGSNASSGRGVVVLNASKREAYHAGRGFKRLARRLRALGYRIERCVLSPHGWVCLDRLIC